MPPLACPRLAWTLALTLAAAGCDGTGATADATGPSTPYVITVSNYMEAPASLGAPAGATVLVQNFDDFDHWFSSSVAPGVYVHSAVGGFDLDLELPARGVRSFALPAGLAAGTVVPYFCRLHLKAELTAGSLTILAP